MAEVTGAPDFSDECIALAFADDHQSTLRYVNAWGKWMVWDGRRWCPDDRLLVVDMVREACRRAALRSANEHAALVRRIASEHTVSAVERLARADGRLAATATQWDADAWLLNTPDGAINLRTGDKRHNRPDDYCTKITAVSAGADCPAFSGFLDRITGGDLELQSFLKRVAGYCLTGLTIEHALFFLHGRGANGKSVFVGALSGILGDYSKVAPIEAFTASRGERHPTELAGLQGARLVTASETEEGRRWAESRVKHLTGGDPISARLMRQDFFEFTPQFKLVITGNHKPGLRNVDEAIRRRLNLVPFSVTIPPGERDPDLAERLKAEWPAILAWMIEGCADWQRDGLAPPTAVRDATNAYLEAEDTITAWLKDCCETGGVGSWTSSSDLYASWCRWCEVNGEQPGSQRRLTESLDARGLKPQRRSKARGFRGLRLVE